MKLRKILASLSVVAVAITGMATPAFADTSAGSWSVDPATEKTGVVLDVKEDGWVHFKASAASGNGTTADKYPSVAIHDGTYDFAKAGSFETTVKSPQAGSQNRFGFYLGYKNPASGLFIGYDASGWFWQRYGAPGNPWMNGDRVAAPDANAEIPVTITWDGTNATLSVNGAEAFTVDYSDMATILSDKIAMKAGVYSTQITEVSVQDDKAKMPDTPPVPPSSGEEITMPDKANKFEIKSGNTAAYLYKEFPQIAFYEQDGVKLAGHLGEPLKSVRVNEADVAVNITGADLDTAGTAATYKVAIPSLNADFTVKISIDSESINWQITVINDPDERIDRIAIPHLDLVTVDGATNGSLMFGTNGTNRTVSSDTTLNVASASENARANGWFAAVSNNSLAAGFLSNAVANVDDSSADGNDVNNRWEGRIEKIGDAKVGTISPGSWVIYGTNARGAGKIGIEEMPFVKVRIVADKNATNSVDWQDSAIATRELMENAGLPNGYSDTAHRVIERIPFNIVSQATHPFLRTLDDTKRISLATDNLGQNVLLKGYQAEGHDSAQGDYGSHYNERAGGFEDLVKLLEASKDFNAKYGVHVNATESYSEAQCFSDGEHAAAGKGVNYENPCTITMPPSAAWGWMNQAYYMDSVQDLTSKNVLNRFQNFRDELAKANVADQLDWLYFDVYYRKGWLARRLASEMQEQGWRVSSEWAWAMADYSIWSHWANDEGYGGQTEKGINSMLVRFIQNSWRDTWNPDPLLGNANTKEFEGWTGQTDYNNFINNVWQRNLPTKFLQQSDVVSYKLGAKASFKNGTEVASSRTSITGKDLGTDRTITYGGKSVYIEGKYLLPWNDTKGVGDNKAGGTKMYHYNPAGGASTWQLTGAFTGVPSFTLYELTDTGRANGVTVANNNGAVTLPASVKANTAYVLYPNIAPQMADPQWGEGTHISDPGFYSGDLEAEGYSTAGNVSVNKTYSANGGRNLGRVAELGAGAASLAQNLSLPKGDYSMWAWVEIEPGKERPVSVSVSGDAKAIGNQTSVKGVPTSSITMSTALNATASDEKLRTYFQRVRVTFHTDGGGVTFKVSAGAGDAVVRIDDLRVVKYTAPVDKARTEKTIFFDDFESVDTGYWPFVTGKAEVGGDARTQMAENHPPYSNAGWYGKNAAGQVVEKGKLTDNVLAGKWSLLAHEENGGLILRTTQASVPFEAGKTYRVSMDYQNAYAGEYVFVLGRDRLTDSGITSSEVKTLSIPEARGTGVDGKGTQTLALEFTTGTSGNYWLGINKVGGTTGSDLTIDNLRVELLDEKPESLPGNADPEISVAQSPVSEGESTTVSTATDFFEEGTPTNIVTTLTGPEGWTITKKGDPAGVNDDIAQQWEVEIPVGAEDGTLMYTVNYDVDNDGVTRSVNATANVKVVRSVRPGMNFLSDLPWADEVNGWGPVERDQENGEQGRNDGTPITLGGTEYAKGLGMHSMGGSGMANITFDLTDKQCTIMRAIVGVNDTQPNGNVTFKVLGDGQTKYESGTVSKATGTQTIDIDITGVKKLQLQVGNANGSNGNDHADWANARVICGTPAIQVKDTKAEVGSGVLSIPVEISGIDTLMPYTVTLSGAPKGFAYNPETNAIEGSADAAFDGDVEVNFKQGDTVLTGMFKLQLTQPSTPAPGGDTSPDENPNPGEKPTPGSGSGGTTSGDSAQPGNTGSTVAQPTIPPTGAKAAWAVLLACALLSCGALMTSRRRYE